MIDSRGSGCHRAGPKYEGKGRIAVSLALLEQVGVKFETQHLIGLVGQVVFGWFRPFAMVESAKHSKPTRFSAHHADITE